LFNFNRGGAEWVITNLYNEMYKNGISVNLISVKNGEMFIELDSHIDSRHFNGNYFKAFIYLFKLLRSNKYDVLFTTQRGATVFAYVVKLLSITRTKHIVREAASNFKDSLNRRNYLSRFLWKIGYILSYSNASKIIVNSIGTKNDLIKAGIILRKKMDIIHINNPVDIGRIQTLSKVENIKKNNNNLKTIVSVGRLVHKKNFDVLIKAISIVKRNKEVFLIIVGDGPERDKLQKLVDSLGLNKYVSIVGYRSNPYPIINSADLFVLASKWEGFGMVIVEALALGVPVIASDIDSGPRYILENGKYGDLVPVDSVEELAESISKNLEKCVDKSILINRAMNFSKEIILKEYINILFY